MKKILTLTSLLGPLLCALPVSLHGQASAVDGMTTLNSTATVNTSFITTRSYWGQTVPTRSTGTYKRVYSCSGNWDDGVTSQSGTMPEDPSLWPDGEYYFETGKWYSLRTFEDGYFYIERYAETYNSTTGALTWSKVLYRGRATVAPTATPLAISATRLWQGQPLTTAASASDDDFDLWSLSIGFRDPLTSQIALASRYDGLNYDTPSLVLNNTRVLSVPGRWRLTLDVEDWAFKTPTPTSAGAELGFFDVAWVEVLPGAYYDPSGTAYTGATAPIITALGGDEVRLRTGQTGLVPVTFKVAGVGAGKPVRVSLGAAGGSALFTSSAGGGAGALFIELVTNANGEVTVWVSPGDRAPVTTALHAIAGRGLQSVRVLTLAAQDSDNDGMSNAMEQALCGSATAVAYSYASNPTIPGFVNFVP